MANFQSLMDVVESDACDPVPVQDGDTGGCIMTRDYLSGEAAIGLIVSFLHENLCQYDVFKMSGGTVQKLQINTLLTKVSL